MADLQLSWWDRFLIGVAPNWGLRRVRARATASLMLRHYEAAGGGRRTSGWYRSGSDANAATATSITRLRELARDLRRNNGWARRGIRVIGTNTVGWGIEPKPMAEADGVVKRAAEIWRDWAGSIACDYDGRMPLAGLQRLVMEAIVESGEALVVRERAGKNDGLPVPLRIRVLEGDYLDHTKDGLGGKTGPIIQGVEFDGRGRRVAYWLHEYHPGALRLSGARFRSRRVPASDVLHIYQVERPGQVRGVSWLAAAIAKLNDFDEYEDAILMQQKIAACFGAFVQDMEGAAEPLGQEDKDDDELETLEPGHIQYLPPGKSISFAQPPAVTDHGGFSATELRRIAVTLNVTYEDLTGDYSQVNFSSARMARLSHWGGVHDWRWNMLIPQFCDGVWTWAMELAAELEGWPEVPRVDWSPPPMPMLEPDKEGLAYSRLVRGGFRTLPQVLRELGEDPAEHLKEIAASNKELDEKGIVLDSDPRRTTASGQVQAGGAEEGDSEDA